MSETEPLSSLEEKQKAEQSTSPEHTPPAAERFNRWLPWIVIALLLGIAVVLWQPLSVLLQPGQNTAQLRAEVANLGILGPLAFFGLSVLQIVGAPIPGYPVQILGGVLFGPILGGIYNVIGLLLGGFTATWLARRLGRPFIEKQINPETLAKYENLAKLETLWMWFILLTIPVGDFPYFLAGLSRVSLKTLLLAVLLARGPTSFLIAWLGDRSLTIPGWIFWAMMAVIFGLIMLGYLLRKPLSRWVDDHVLHRLQ